MSNNRRTISDINANTDNQAPKLPPPPPPTSPSLLLAGDAAWTRSVSGKACMRHVCTYMHGSWYLSSTYTTHQVGSRSTHVESLARRTVDRSIIHHVKVALALSAGQWAVLRQRCAVCRLGACLALSWITGIGGVVPCRGGLEEFPCSDIRGKISAAALILTAVMRRIGPSSGAGAEVRACPRQACASSGHFTKPTPQVARLTLMEKSPG